MKLLTIKQTAEQLQVSGQTIGRMIAEGTLPAFCLRSGRRKKVWRVRSEALEKWVASKERETTRDIAGSRAPTASNGKHDDSSQTNSGI